MTNKLPTFGVDRVDRKGKLARHNAAGSVEDYKAAIRRTNLPAKRKAELLASPQIPPGDREHVSPIGGAVW